MFRRKKSGSGARLPGFMKGFSRPDVQAEPMRPSGSLSELVDAASDKQKCESERCAALSALTERVCMSESDISALEPRLGALLEEASDSVASAASTALAANFLGQGDFQSLLSLASHPRFAVRKGAISEAEVFVVACGYDARMGPVFAAGLLEDDPDIRRACRVAFSEGAGKNDEWAAKFLAVATEREKKGRLDS
ncbi:MAG TPA: hypothetical protein VLD37_07025 [Candidatus Bilamarchaeum sp.]|nr:hypothetical protein [Candidatus Bilamarchaeum sp.]